LENFGGHTYAAGLSLKEDNMQAFTERFMKISSEEISTEQMIPQIDIDEVITLRDINESLMRDLKRMNPFGPDNEKPVFVTYNVRDYGTSRVVGKDGTHLKLDLTDDSVNLPTKAIAFGMGDYETLVKDGNPIDICFTVEENTYNNNTTIQLMIKDIRPSEMQTVNK